MLKEISQKIIDILKADTELGVPAENFFFGPPFTRNRTPFVYVSWAGGPIRLEALGRELWRHDWHVVVVDVAKQDDTAEKSVMDKVERIREDLRKNPTLDGLVRDSLPVSIEGETVTVGTDWGKVTQIIAGARLTLRCEVSKEA